MSPKYNESIEQKVVGGLLKGIWYVLSWPFHKKRLVVHTHTKASFDTQYIKNKWQEIEGLVALGGESRFKAVILEADKLLNHMLEGLGARGNTLAERLRSSQAKFSPSTYQALWEAHKVRNNITHDVDYQLTSFTAKDAIFKYQAGLKELGAL